MGRSKLQGTPWHYENIYEVHNNMPKKKDPYEYPYSYKKCYFDNYNVCKNPNCKHYNNECSGFELCVNFSLTEKPPKTYQPKQRNRKNKSK